MPITWTKRQAKVWALLEMANMADAHADDNLGLGENEKELGAAALKELARDLCKQASEV